MSIRFKVILPYLLLTLFIAITGAYVVTRLVYKSLAERLSNQLIEAGRVVSDSMVRQEVKHLEAARVIAYTRGLGEALSVRDAAQVLGLAKPVTGGLNVESLTVFNVRGEESIHFIKQSNGTIMDVSQQGRASTLPIVRDLLSENNPESLPKRTLAIDPVDGRYYYFTAIPVLFNEQVVGTVVVGTSLNTILPTLKSVALADVIFYDENGKAIASTVGTQGTDALFLRTISIPSELRQSVVESKAVVHGQDIEADGRKYSLAYGLLKVGNDNLTVFSVVLPLDFVIASGTVNRDTYILIYSVAMIAVILIGYFISRLIIAPLSKLVRASRAIAGGDLTKRTEIKSTDEIGVLASTFDEMTDHLQQRTLELERTNQVLEQMDRAKMRFIQVAAHELRTPLTLVQGYSQMVEVKSKGNDDLARYTRGILEGTSRMVEIIDNMLDVSLIDMNRLELLPAEVTIQSVIEKANKTFAAALEERQLTFRTEGLDALPVIHGDTDLLYKLFYHVIVNAIKYTPNGGQITVCGKQVSDDSHKPEIEVTIQDTGIGIDPQNQELVFEKFYQTGEVLLHSSGKTKFRGGGPGLGLAIARGIVNAHHGRIWLESPGFNEETYPGTTVFVRLPVNGHSDESK